MGSLIVTCVAAAILAAGPAAQAPAPRRIFQDFAAGDAHALVASRPGAQPCERNRDAQCFKGLLFAGDTWNAEVRFDRGRLSAVALTRPIDERTLLAVDKALTGQGFEVISLRTTRGRWDQIAEARRLAQLGTYTAEEFLAAQQRWSAINIPGVESSVVKRYVDGSMVPTPIGQAAVTNEVDLERLVYAEARWADVEFADATMREVVVTFYRIEKPGVNNSLAPSPSQPSF